MKRTMSLLVLVGLAGCGGSPIAISGGEGSSGGTNSTTGETPPGSSSGTTSSADGSSGSPEMTTSGSESSTRRWQDVDRAALSVGVEPLASFLELSLVPGAPRHSSGRGLETVSALLAVRSLRDDAALARGLRSLHRQLEAAPAQGAKFCLTPTSGWSGQCEAIGLFLGTHDSA